MDYAMLKHSAATYNQASNTDEQANNTTFHLYYLLIMDLDKSWSCSVAVVDATAETPLREFGNIPPNSQTSS
jgi:hypothetical protein